MPSATSHDGVALHYDLHDFTDPWTTKPTVLLQHGFGRSGRMWFGTIPALARHYRIICPDFRGLGHSGRNFDPATGINAANYLADLRAILDHAGVDQAHFVGESIGGTVGYAFAAEHPERVRTLSVMASPTHINDWMRRAYAAGHPSWPEAIETLGSAGWAAATNTAARFPAEMGAGFHEWYAAQIGQAPTPVLAAMARFAMGVNVEPLLPKITAPVLGLFPSAGQIATTEQEATLRRLIPDVRTVRMSTPYHMVQFMQPAACAEQVLRFLLLQDGIAG
jgi:3-oxoadipate enol-lactonase